MRLLRALRTGLGLAGFALLLAVTLAPELFSFPSLGLDLRQLDPELLRLAAAAAIGLSLLYSVFAPQYSSSEETLESLPRAPPEEIHGRETRRAGDTLDAAYDALGEGDTELADSFQDRLRSAAVRLYAVANGCSATEARRAVDEGRWTDDPRAAAFLGDDVDPLPLQTRLWDFFRPGHPLEHRVRHTVEALEAFGDDGGKRP
ncbi:DUF7269 family protein [Natronomonas sp. EA1]|uniref:DUF7269 family protein n=1 Tax=Natronomonas sp. EA1 TaxID=3421655 RepID=UPI003EC144D7